MGQLADHRGAGQDSLAVLARFTSCLPDPDTLQLPMGQMRSYRHA